jgi:hypothetical protein
MLAQPCFPYQLAFHEFQHYDQPVVDGEGLR